MQQSRLDRILALLCSVLDAYSAVLFLPETTEEGGTPAAHVPAASFSLGNSLDAEAKVIAGRGLVGWVLRHQEPLLVSNFDRRSNQLGYYTGDEEQYIKAFMGCALPGGGVLCVDSKRQYSFSEKDQKLLYLFASLAAELRDENESCESLRTTARYYAALRAVYDLRRKHTRWNDFLRHFLDLMAVMTGWTYAALCTRDAYGENYTVEGESDPLLLRGANMPTFPMSLGVVGWVFRNNAPILGFDPDGLPETPLIGRTQDVPRFQSVMAVPLIFQRKTRGVLCLADGIPKNPGDAGRDFVLMAAEHLALFLENLYIKCRLRDLHHQVPVQTELSPGGEPIA